MSIRIGSELRFQGSVLSKGCAVGQVCMFNDYRHQDLPAYRIEADEADAEIRRIEEATTETHARLEKLRTLVESDIGKAEAEIFVAQQLILKDEALLAQIEGYLRENLVNAESAVRVVFDEQEEKFASIDNEYIRARATDIAELKRRVLDVLGNMRPELRCGPENCEHGRNRIVVAEELTPSLTIEIDPESTIGFICERGGVNSHAAILARALGIPAVSNIKGIRDKLGCGMEVLINGETGEVVVWPSESTINSTIDKCDLQHGLPEAVEPIANLTVLANVGVKLDIENAIEMRAEGIGLYRTEFDLLLANRFLSEDELFESYSEVRRMIPEENKVIFRMFDIGSDKQLPFMDIPEEGNPALGWRGSRLLMGNEDLHRDQARALARASRHGRIHVMYPMVFDLDQYLELEGRFDFFTDGIEGVDVELGIMFEVPSACLQAELIFDHIDFGSIGTNDLAQYLFAIDRENELVSDAFDSGHDIFWSLMESVAAAAAKSGKHLSVCGELAGEPEFTKRFLSIGIRELSVSPRRVSAVRNSAIT